MDRRPAAAVVAAGVLLAPAAPALAAEAPQVPGLVVYASEFDVDQTTRRVEEALAEAGMVTATLDHRANAASVGAELRPTTLVIGGAPQAGTPLLLADQAVGIDLPQKFLAWQDEDGDVWLGYNSAEYVAARAGIDTGAGALSGLRDGTARLAAAATGSESPEALGSPSSGDGSYRVEQQSDASVEESIARYHEAFAAAGLTPLATVDHAAGAASIGEQLRPTTVTFVGNPELGTPLIAESQTMGIDLPTRFLARRGPDGRVTVGHVDVAAAAARHGVTGQDDLLATVTAGTARFTAAAAGASQVAEVPAGGVDTGRGGTSGVEGRSLLALGASSLLAAVALGAAARGRTRPDDAGAARGAPGRGTSGSPRG